MPPKIALEDNIGTTKPKCWFRCIVLLLQLKNEAHGRYLKRWIDQQRALWGNATADGPDWISSVLSGTKGAFGKLRKVHTILIVLRTKGLFLWRYLSCVKSHQYGT